VDWSGHRFITRNEGVPGSSPGVGSKNTCKSASSVVSVEDDDERAGTSASHWFGVCSASLRASAARRSGRATLRTDIDLEDGLPTSEGRRGPTVRRSKRTLGRAARVASTPRSTRRPGFNHVGRDELTEPLWLGSALKFLGGYLEGADLAGDEQERVPAKVASSSGVVTGERGASCPRSSSATASITPRPLRQTQRPSDHRSGAPPPDRADDDARPPRARQGAPATLLLGYSQSPAPTIRLAIEELV
jgi:hypothetical protein